MNSYHQLATYQQRSAVEIMQVKSGFAYGAALALVLWAMLAAVLVLVLR